MRIRYINDNGEEVSEELVSRTVKFVEGEGENGFEFVPAAVERVEYDHEGQMSSITNVCGETENRRETDDKPKIVVEGIIIEPQIERIQRLKNLDTVTLISDVFQGRVEIRRVTVEQNTDLIEVEFDNQETELAFAFQIQLREP